VKSVYEIIRPNRKASKRAPAWPVLARRRLGWTVVAALALVIGLLAWSSFQLRADTAYNTHNLIRLHVVANSDKPGDQEVKLEVRDAILKATGDLFSGDLFAANPPAEAALAVKENLPLFKRVAENVLRASGYDYLVNVEFGTFAFPERAYGPLVLPVGDYEALRVVLGDGKGANWWCILFPPLCYLDVVGGNRLTQWGLTPGGALAAAASGAGGSSATGSGAGSAAGLGASSTRVVSLDSLTPAQVEDLETVLGRALDNMASPKAGDGGVKVILSDIPSSPDTDLVILVADTGTNRTEVRFYVFDRLRDLIRSLAESAPWLVESLPEGATRDAMRDR